MKMMLIDEALAEQIMKYHSALARYAVVDNPENSKSELKITQFLTTYFRNQLAWTFVGKNAGNIPATDFFAPDGFLPAFVHIANRMASDGGSNILSEIKVVDDPSSLLGFRACVVAPDGCHQATLNLLIEAVKNVCGDLPNRNIDPGLLFDYLKDRDESNLETIKASPLRPWPVRVATEHPSTCPDCGVEKNFEIQVNRNQTYPDRELYGTIICDCGYEMSTYFNPENGEMSDDALVEKTASICFKTWQTRAPEGLSKKGRCRHCGEIKPQQFFGEKIVCNTCNICAGSLNDVITDIPRRKMNRPPLLKKKFYEYDLENDQNDAVDVMSPFVEVLSPASLKNLEKLILNSADRDSKNRLEALFVKIKESNRRACVRKNLAAVSGAETLDGMETERFPNFQEFFEYLRSQFILAMVGDGVFRLDPILLLGEPGIGKTEVLLRLSNILKTGFLLQNMAAAQSGSLLSGSDIHWANTRQGALFELLVFGNTANPVVMLDEIDKVITHSWSSSPISALYGLLERRSAANFEDLSLPGVRIDASHVVWFAAANEERTIDPAILSRFRIFRIPAPTKAQMPVIIKSIYSDLLERESWGKAFNPDLPVEVLNVLEAVPPRNMRQIMEAACARAATDGRREVLPKDLSFGRKSKPMGFC